MTPAAGSPSVALGALLHDFVGGSAFDPLYGEILRLVRRTCAAFRADYSPTGAWNRDAYEEVAHEVVARLFERGILVQYDHEGRTDDGIRRGIEMIVRNLLADSRRKRRGRGARVRSEVLQCLRHAACFAEVQTRPGVRAAWGLHGWGPRDPFAGGSDRLRETIAAVPFRGTVVGPTAKGGFRQALADLLEEVLAAVDAPLSLDLLCTAVTDKMTLEWRVESPLDHPAGMQPSGEAREPLSASLATGDFTPEDLAHMSADVDRLLLGLDGTERVVLRAWFLEQEEWSEIASETGKSIRTLQRARDRVESRLRSVIEHADRVALFEYVAARRLRSAVL